LFITNLRKKAWKGLHKKIMVVLLKIINSNNDKEPKNDYSDVVSDNFDVLQLLNNVNS